MGPALMGLTGVAVGALLSSLAAFSMARRAERRQARAAARLLEAELRHVVGRLQLLTSNLAMPNGQSLGPSKSPRFSDFQSLLNVPKPRLWDEHRATLATVLPSDDWYAGATAYESIDALRGAATAAGLFLDEGQIAHSAIGELLTTLATEAQVGAEAVARLAGNPRSTATGSTLRDMIVSVLHEKARRKGSGE